MKVTTGGPADGVHSAAALRSMSLSELNQVATGVIEDSGGHGAHGDRRLREAHASTREAVEFGLDILDTERREGNAVGDECVLERPRCGVPIGFEEQLHAVARLGRDNA